MQPRLRLAAPRLALALLIGLPAVASCAPAPALPAAPVGPIAEAPGSHETELWCEKPLKCEPGTVCQGEACAAAAVLRWSDTVDNGDDPWVPGCHLTHQTADCSDAGTFFGGDECLTGTLLFEYTATECHPSGHPGDMVSHDCEKLCKAKGHTSGWCSTVRNACGQGQSSAQCKCWDPPPEG